MAAPADQDSALLRRWPGGRVLETGMTFGKLKLIVVRAQHVLAPARLLLLLHGYGSGIDACLRLPVARLVNGRTALALVEGGLPGAPYGGRAWCRLTGSDAERREALEAQADEVEACIGGYLADTGAARGAVEVLPIGFSQGGSLALALGLRSMLPLRRAISIAGTLPPGIAPRAPELCGRGFHLVHGSADRFVPSGSGESLRARLKALGCCAVLERVAGAGHVIDAGIWRAVRRILASDPPFARAT